MSTKDKKKSHWSLVYTKPNKEKVAQENLVNQGFETFLPMIDYQKSSNPKAYSLEVMFPRYVFIKVNLDSGYWTSIRSTKGVSHIIMFDNKLAVVPKGIVEFLKTNANNGVFKHDIKREEFQKGDQLTIKQGILKGMDATFLTKKSKERVRILINLLNNQIVADIPAIDAGKKEITKAFKV